MIKEAIPFLIILACLSGCKRPGLKQSRLVRPQVTLETVSDIEAQPLSLQMKRLVEALNYLGHPLPKETQNTLLNGSSSEGYSDAVQGALDRGKPGAVVCEAIFVVHGEPVFQSGYDPDDVLPVDFFPTAPPLSSPFLTPHKSLGLRGLSHFLPSSPPPF